ncbi:MAG: hypothetical protein ABIK39_04795 [candidate division WOR-3 bacterium]
MNSKVRLHPVAFDSFGVKGMCTRIETKDLVVTIDPGASMETDIFPLPEEERQKLLKRFQEAIFHSCLRSSIIVITHYHLDHLTLAREPQLYSGKVLFAKSLDDLPQKQVETAQRFFKSIDGLPKEIIWADGRQFKFKKTVVGFSLPLWHGQAEAEPGRVIMVYVKRGRETVLVSSDVAGATDPVTVEAVTALNPVTAVIDGYPTYLKDSPAADIEVIKSIINLCRLLALPNLKTLIVDHHLARDYRYPALFQLLYWKGKELRKRFGTAAEIAGKRSAVLEGLEKYGTTRWQRWQPIGIKEAQRTMEKAVAEASLDKKWLDEFSRWVISPSKG